MKRRLICFLIAAAMVVMTTPAAVAHSGSGTDMNEILYNDVWDILGPGGATDEPEVKNALETAGLNAEETGGSQTDACTHHGDPSFTAGMDPWDVDCTSAYDTAGDKEGGAISLTSFTCQGQDPDTSASSVLETPTETDFADVQMQASMPFHYNNVNNSILEATGSFFVDFEFEGEDAQDVEQVFFSYLTNFPWPVSSSLCQGQITQPGVYYEFYRGDTFGEDGWEIPINTLLVPDAPYGAVVRALSETCAPLDSACVSANTIVAGFTYANVNNYLDDPDFQPGGTPETCDDGGCPFHDTTPPNGIVYTGDEIKAHLTLDDQPGARPVNLDNNQCIGSDAAIEFGEPLAADGAERKLGSDKWGIAVEGGGNVVKYTPPERDVDALPASTTSTNEWGPGYCFKNADDQITVTAWDQLGNQHTQVIDTTTGT